MRAKKHEWEAEIEALLAEKQGIKDEMRKLEYDIYDILKLNFENK
jgi:hypothetical protein